MCIDVTVSYLGVFRWFLFTFSIKTFTPRCGSSDGCVALSLCCSQHHSHSSLVIGLPDLNRGWLVSILVGPSITAVDTNVVQYGVWVYATHAFRQSADIARPASVRSVES